MDELKPNYRIRRMTNATSLAKDENTITMSKQANNRNFKNYIPPSTNFKTVKDPKHKNK